MTCRVTNMNYIATVRNDTESFSMMFKTSGEAQRWLDEHNGMDKDTIIEEYDDDWQKKDSFFYTRRKE